LSLTPVGIHDGKGSGIMYLSFGMIIFIVLLFLANAIRVLREYERAVIFRLGRLIAVKGPGLIILIPVIDRMVKVSLRVVPMDVAPQDVITRDNVSVKVNAVIYFRVIDPNKSVINVEDYLFATMQMAQTTLRSVVGQAELDDLLSNREKLNMEIQEILDKATDPWGIKVSTVEIKDVDLPVEMRRAMARQAEAERERRSKIIHADGEYQASKQLAEAAKVISSDPATIQLRYLQTLTDISRENNSVTIFPVPIDLITYFIERKALQKPVVSPSAPDHERGGA
jgi:regulator of protease activity HflC (stomatin/prohibitin superfamily)